MRNTMLKAGLSLLALLLALASAGCFKPRSADLPLGSEKNPLVMAFVPSTEAQNVMSSGEQLAAALQQETGLYYKPLVATSYVGIVEAMGAGSVHVGWLPPLAYVFAHDRNGDEVVLKVVRHGKATYRGMVVVMADSPLQSLADLKGKRVAFPDQASASGHLYPRALMLEQGVNPDTDFAETSFSGGHDSALLALLKGGADAACCYDDARTKLVEGGYPDIMSTTRALAYTADIPADNVTLAAALPSELRAQISAGLSAVAASETGKKILMDLYEIEGLEPATDADYDPVRKMAEVLKLDIEQEVEKGG
ncbi:phosphate/phosphite/phosphonate ABC transporter substrate-binding protein [bacterium]|nr:phosphate/phosphite/phosphonate ABC transporter substrate-binding protein [bacterium]